MPYLGLRTRSPIQATQPQPPGVGVELPGYRMVFFSTLRSSPEDFLALRVVTRGPDARCKTQGRARVENGETPADKTPRCAQDVIGRIMTNEAARRCSLEFSKCSGGSPFRKMTRTLKKKKGRM